ncbi:hypothetical protein C1645_825608 [Glomus cerebriforme]|uniref:Uncharacterized protein n=1 Tax=Glomus cerebriforme TaxID=658196 RepID=A0A397SYN7_9GLOM|nr:hypothetical protein C1645_825608 [Glomus cerebriforme]
MPISKARLILKFRCSSTPWTDVDFNVQFLGTLDVQDFGRGSQLHKFSLLAALLVEMLVLSLFRFCHLLNYLQSQNVIYL